MSENVILVQYLSKCSCTTTFFNTTKQLVEKDAIAWFKVLGIVSVIYVCVYRLSGEYSAM